MEFRVRYAECDAMGHLHHARYWEYFESARVELLRRNGIRYRDLEREGVFFVVHKASVTYRRRICYDDLVAVSVRVDRITRTRVEHSYTITNDGVVACTAQTTLACVDAGGRPQAMPDALWSPA